MASSRNVGSGEKTNLPCPDTESCDEIVLTDVVGQQMPDGSNSGTTSVNSPAIFASLRHQVEKTLPSITNKLNRVLTVAEENIIPKGHEVTVLSITS